MMVRVLLLTFLILAGAYYVLNTMTQPMYDPALAPYATVGTANDLNTYPGMRYFTTIPVPGSPGLVMRVL